MRMGPILFPETWVYNYHTTPRNITEESRSHPHCGGSLSLRIPDKYLIPYQGKVLEIVCDLASLRGTIAVVLVMKKILLENSFVVICRKTSSLMLAKCGMHKLIAAKFKKP
jgi:hypothetical protein